MSHPSLYSRTAAALLSATLVLAAVPAGAAETPGATVQSGDLNLATDAGRAALQHRIAHAVNAVCGSAHARTTSEIQAYADCSKAARAGAAIQFDAVTAAARSGKKVANDGSNAASVR